MDDITDRSRDDTSAERAPTSDGLTPIPLPRTHANTKNAGVRTECGPAPDSQHPGGLATALQTALQPGCSPSALPRGSRELSPARSTSHALHMSPLRTTVDALLQTLGAPGRSGLKKLI